MNKGVTTKNLFSHSNGSFMAAKVTDKAAPKTIQMLALWQRAQPHSMPGSFSLILIPKTKIKETIRKNTFTDGQRFSDLRTRFTIVSARRLAAKS